MPVPLVCVISPIVNCDTLSYTVLSDTYYEVRTCRYVQREHPIAVFATIWEECRAIVDKLVRDKV